MFRMYASGESRGRNVLTFLHQRHKLTTRALFGQLISRTVHAMMISVILRRRYEDVTRGG